MLQGRLSRIGDYLKPITCRFCGKTSIHCIASESGWTIAAHGMPDGSASRPAVCPECAAHVGGYSEAAPQFSINTYQIGV